MRRLFVVGLLMASMSVPSVALAESSSALPVSGTVSASGASKGTLSGSTTIGGVSGTLASSGGNWTMTVGAVTFATGTYSCSSGSCNYTGTIVGSTTTFDFTTNSTTGMVTDAAGFATHGAWVSAVAQWAGAHQTDLTAAGLTVGDIVSGAAKIEGGLAGRGHANGDPGSHASSNGAGHDGSGHGGGDHGGDGGGHR